ncbi:hypothetical protein AC1031_008991 [Aphanomyces cochlioides]|nr:hypothetical protein AC1031_008991 [Aphanomyces cochlioides]
MWMKLIWTSAVAAIVAAQETWSIADELRETERLIHLQEQKLALLRQMRLGNTENNAKPLPNVRDVLAHLDEKTCQESSLSSQPFKKYFVERSAVTVNTQIVAQQALYIQHPLHHYHLTASLIFVATQSGQLYFYELPTGALISTLDLLLSSDVVTAVIDVATGVLTVAYPSSVAQFNMTFWEDSHLCIALGTNATIATVADGQSITQLQTATIQGDPLVLYATNLSNVHVVHPKHSVDVPPTSLAHPINVMATHRHLLVLSQGPDVWLFPVARLAEKIHYVCQGTPSASIISLSFDPNAPTIMYAGTSSGGVLVFDLYADRTRSCRLVHVIPPTSSAKELGLLTLPGYLLIASIGEIRVFNTTGSPRFLFGLESTTPPQASSMPKLVLLPKWGNDGSETQHDVICLAHGKSILMLESLLPAPLIPSSPTLASTITAFIDALWTHLPLAIVAALGLLVVWKFMWPTAPVGQSPPSIDEYMMRHKEETFREAPGQRKAFDRPKPDLETHIY